MRRTMKPLPDPTARLVRVEAPHFTAALLLAGDDFVIDAAPILHWTVGKHRKYLSQYFRRKKWTVTILPSPAPILPNQDPAP